MRKSDGSLHYYINGIDQGVAATNTPRRVWGVVDLYGMAVKVTIVDRENAVYPTYSGDNPTLNNRTNNYIRRMQAFETEPARGIQLAFIYTFIEAYISTLLPLIHNLFM